MAEIIDDKVVHNITLINGVKLGLVETEGAIYLQMYDPDPITFVKINSSGVHSYGEKLTDDELNRLLYGKLEKICTKVE